MSIPTQQDSAFQQGRLRNDERVVLFLCGQQILAADFLRDPLDDSVSHRHQIQRLESPRPQLREGAKSGLADAFGFPAPDSQGQFVKHRGRNNELGIPQSLANRADGIRDDLNFPRQIQQDVGISGDEHEPRPLVSRKRFAWRPPSKPRVRCL